MIRRQTRYGYTLFELLLVLAILLIVAGAVWPGITSVYERHLLLQAVDDIRNQIARGRRQAVEQGVVYQFQYEPGGRIFSVLPFEPGQEMQDTLSGELPETMRFGTPDPLTAPGSMNTATLPTDAFESPANNPGIQILFAPDGTAMDAAFDVVDSEERFVRVSVRGLTAAVSVGDVRRRTGP